MLYIMAKAGITALCQGVNAYTFFQIAKDVLKNIEKDQMPREIGVKIAKNFTWKMENVVVKQNR